jgi:choline dehydrogenase-like flavoprotein
LIAEDISTINMSDNINSDGQGEGLYGIDNAPSSLPALSACARGFLSEAYDFVIIGGGTAGLAVAARLTEDPNIIVGVLEVGKSRLDNPLVDTPATFPHLLGDPEYDHCFKSVPQVSVLLCVSGPLLTVISGRKSWYRPSLEQRKSSWRLERHQLYAVGISSSMTLALLKY